MLRFPFNKKSKIKKLTKEYIEPNEIFLDSLAKKKEEELNISEKKIEVPLSYKLLKSFFAFSFFLLFVLFLRTIQFQVFENKELLAKSNRNKFVSNSLESYRGVIYDSKGKQLVFNKLSFDLIVDKKKLFETEKEKNDTLKMLSEIFNLSEKELEEKINKEDGEKIVLFKNIDSQPLIKLKPKILDFKSLEIKVKSIRNYSDGPVFSHILGYMGQINKEELENFNEYSLFDSIGKSGLEKFYESILREKQGKIQVEKDAYGNILSEKVISTPQSGKSLVLYLDADLQKKITEEMEKMLKEVNGKKGAAVAIDPRTGGVLSLVSFPLFDNNIFTQEDNKDLVKNILEDKNNPLFNRAVSAQYPTGSIIKPLISSAALEEKIISPEKKINCQGKITILNPYNPEKETIKKDWTTHGLTDMRKAIAESCNVYFYTIGGGYKDQIGLGPTKIKKYLELFGWGNKTGIDIFSESKGFIPTPQWKKEFKGENWYNGDTYNLSIGQGDILITPLQVALSYSAIANNGILFKPLIVKEIIDENKNIIQENKPQIIRENFTDKENLKVVREGMRMTVTAENAPLASAPSLNDLPVKVAAKTGTAETGKNNYLHKWITVFAPYDNPEIVLTIVIEDIPDTQPTTIPIAKEVLNWYFKEKITK
ncbi:MAG TPA: penicillin-binding protein 2 [Candidatus Pacearchaeota archaeon]|mgnify:CR=1 FL=1|nr:penicillin-binding protein 2 [Candidatus Pacearchaeota archaeon]HOL90413.1 penicillin-binding protein 2 [Candidatus Pacearchaeota archaeon]HPO68583.1 penicillin-binding protein 2 [Candidatus Pacearchaeota archaeon]